MAKPLLTSTGLASKSAPDVDDLIHLAEWIISGEEEDLYPFLLSDQSLQIGPEAVLYPNGYAVIRGVRYAPEGEDSDGTD